MSKILAVLRIRRPVSKPVRYLLAFIGLISLVSLIKVHSQLAATDRFLTFQATLYLFSATSENVFIHPGGSIIASKEELETFVPKPIVPENVTIFPAVDPATARANATLLMLARNDDISGVEASMRTLEARFNRAHGYPWTFLNEVPFNEEFKTRVAALTDSEVRFGLVPHEHWFQPDWIDEARKLTSPWPIPYASSTPYRNMCRFNSGFFFRHELLKSYKWYWRVEPNVDFTCNINFDPFVYMIENNKRYSFVISLKEVAPTVPSLWDSHQRFRKSYPEVISENNALPFITNNDGETYNLCHFWSNFEIADLDFFRSDFYLKYFDFLDSTGNFYYERWGDAPVHSIAAALFMPRDQLHFFNEIGYSHAPFQHCPSGPLYKNGQCSCPAWQNYGDASCLRKFEQLFHNKEIG
ncbi:glycosyl transferase [Phellopilus nigrolimitatus]|nr:glycosyl transferase [Phellopilus nigrolimitatus]